MSVVFVKNANIPLLILQDYKNTRVIIQNNSNLKNQIEILKNDRKALFGRRFDLETQDKRNADNVRYIIWDIEVNQEKIMMVI